MHLDPHLLQETKSHRPALILTIGLGLAGGLLTVLQACGLSQAIDRVFLKGQALPDIISLLALLLVVIFLRAGTAWGGEVAAHRTAAGVKRDLRIRLYNHIAALGPSYTSGERSGELSNTIVEGIEALDAYFSQYLPQLALAALVPPTVLVFVFPRDLISSLVLLFTAPLIPIFMILVGSLAETLTRKQWLSLSRMSAYFLDVLQGLTTLKILGRSLEQARLIARLSERYRDVTMSVLRVTFLSALALELVATLSTAIVAVEIGLRLLYGQLYFEQALFILILAPEFYLPLRLLGARFHAGMAGFEAAQRIYSILETPLPEQNRQNLELATVKPGQAPDSYLSSPISFENISYHYPDERHALDGTTFRLEPGRITALVGPSGAGKSTIAALLLRFIEPQTGLIRVGQTPLNEIPLEDWRSQVAWVPQNPYLFNASLAANLGLGRLDASRKEIEEAARRSSADAFIQRLPRAYDTCISERGALLSGGQAQQLAVARVFLKNSPILILDEVTSQLDPETEDCLQEAIWRLAEGRTTLIIAHRLATVRRAHQIVVLDKGSLVQCGSYADLLRQVGLFRGLVHVWDDSGVSSSPLEATLSPPSINARVLSLPSEKTSIISDTDLSPVSPLSSISPRPDGHLSGLAVLLRLLGLACPFAGLIALSTLMGSATVGSAVGLMAASAYILSAAALHPSIATLQVAIVGVRFFGISRGLFRYLDRYISHQVTFRLLARLRVWFYQSLEPLAPARLLAYHSGDLVSRLIGDIAALENFYVRVIAPPMAALLVSLGMMLYMRSFDPSLAWVLLTFLALGGIGVPFLIESLSRKVGRQLVAARSALSASLVDGIQGLPDLLAFGQERRHLDLILQENRGLESAQRRMADFGGLLSSLNVLLANLGMLAVLIVAVPLVTSGRLPGLYLAVVTLAALTCFEAIQPLPLAAQYLESSLAAARHLLEVVDASPAVIAPPNPLPLPPSFNLEIKDLDFAYLSSIGTAGASDREAWRLTLDYLSLPKGKRAALVGPTGAGKSTLVNLVLRFWDYQEGTILLEGQDLRCFDPKALRDAIGVVAQQTYLFNATLRDNILLGRPDASQSQVEQAARQAQLHDFVLGLPQGYDTWIGERGLRLSAGERQRVAIARALLKNAPFLILDEPTANLDTINEKLVLDAIHTLMEGRTTLMITHRLVGMDWMDEILVLQGGRIVERGHHDGLLKQRGLYRRMWDLQNQALD